MQPVRTTRVDTEEPDCQTCGDEGAQSVARKVRPGHSRDLPARVSYLC